MLQLGSSIERRVMGDEVLVTGERREVAHDAGCVSSVREHAVVDAGVLLDEGGDLYTGVHQRLKLVDDESALQAYGADLDGAVAAVRG